MEQYYQCVHCSKYCPNMFVYNAHHTCYMTHKNCPEDHELQTSMVTPAFLLTDEVINYFDSFCSEYSEYLPLDLICTKAIFRNYTTNETQTTQISLLLQKEKSYMTQQSYYYTFLIFIEAALLSYTGEHKLYNPPILSMPYFSFQKIQLFLAKMRNVILETHYRDIKKTAKRMHENHLINSDDNTHNNNDDEAKNIENDSDDDNDKNN